MEKPIAVSMRADKVLTQSLKALAETKRTTVADLTRKAVDQVWGPELTPYINFFASIDSPNSQSTFSEVASISQGDN